ncbi:MAG: NAD-dependent epimerase/dehydratase family protein [Gemmatimonadetes bacterium]|nr:NAD-dependent epimerase/dehydratase family protein [Gemmatimonadota bacterium]
MDRVLVIGGTLFIGRALVEQLLTRGDEVVIMHRGTGTPFGGRVGEIRCDRNDISGVRSALADRRFDVVYDNVYDWQRGTTAEQVAAAARAVSNGLRRYVFTSSVAAYPIGGPYDEDAPLTSADDPNDYARHKAESERALFALGRHDGVGVSTLRPAFVYGPNNPFDREAFFWDRICAGRPIIIPGDGTATMQWVHAHDVARAAVLAADREVANGRAYNLGNTPPITQAEFVLALARAAGREATLVHVPRERIAAAGGGLMAPPLYFGAYLDIPPISIDVERVRRELGLELTPLDEGLRATYRWYAEQERPVQHYGWEDDLIASSSGTG